MGTVQQAAERALHLAPVVLRGQAAVLLVCLPPRISPIQNPLKALWNIPTLPTFFLAILTWRETSHKQCEV